MSQIDTTNDFLIGLQSKYVVFVKPPGYLVSREQALRTAAWLKFMAEMLPDETGVTFEQIEEAIRST